MAEAAGWSSTLRIVAVSWAIVATPSCGEQRGKLTPNGGLGGSGGLSAAGGSDSTSGTGGSAQAGATTGEGGAAGVPPSTTGGSPAEGGAPAAGGAPPGGAPSGPGESCVYHRDFAASAGGAGGAGSAPTITKAPNRLIGDYLADAAGFALYVFGADLAGDCKAPPVSTCSGDCLSSWPIFYAEQPVVLAPGLDEAAFGTIVRDDGLPQTTYFGWPLYYYANDTEAGDVTGHGSGVWGLAETILPNVFVRRAGMDRFLSDGAGRTLYAFAEDALGTTSEPPVSSCLDACRQEHPPFSVPYVGAISTLEPRDFAVFARGDGGLQVAYKGAPLYFSSQDTRPGDVNGASEAGWTIVLR